MYDKSNIKVLAYYTSDTNRLGTNSEYYIAIAVENAKIILGQILPLYLLVILLSLEK